MRWRSDRKSHLIIWQLLFILLGTSWLWAPQLNHGLPGRTALISQYEAPGQSYAWLFRLGDAAAAVLLILAAIVIQRYKKASRPVWTLLVIVGLGMLIDTTFASACSLDRLACRQQLSFSFVTHAIETVVTASALFGLVLYDAAVRKRVVSIGFLVFQMAYGLLLLSQLATSHRFNSLSQYVYQLAAVVWLAWFVHGQLAGQYTNELSNAKSSLTRRSAAVWAFLNGLAAIVLGLSHLHLHGRVKDLYFAGDSAWLAQHGVAVGAVMIYLSRHLARGERRARQIFLLICGLEAIKFSLISPHPILAIYVITFGLLFVLGDEFYRGTVVLTWRKRLKEAAFIGASLVLATAVGFIFISHDNDAAQVAAQAIDNFLDYSLRSVSVPKSHIPGALLAHTVSALIVVGGLLILWVLFRPYKKIVVRPPDYQQVEKLLRKYSNSSEDFFKLWPRDKQYFWSKEKTAFIAYKISGGTAFALADPIGRKSDQQQLIGQFLQWCRHRRLTACFLPIYSKSRGLYANNELSEIQIGSSAVVEIQGFLSKTAKDKWWRWQTNRAAKSGYIYSLSLPPHSKSFLKELEAVSKSWLSKNGRKERDFALGYFDREYLQKCPIHFLKDGAGQVQAFTNQLPSFKKSDTATIDLLRYQADANNAMPFLLRSTIENLAEQYQKFDLGFVPFASTTDPVINIARALSVGRFSAGGLEQFKNKFDPDWQPNYMAYDGDLADLAIIGINLERVMEADL